MELQNYFKNIKAIFYILFKNGEYTTSLFLGKKEQRNFKGGCNFTIQRSDIQFVVVKFFGFFNENFLSFFLQLECCVIWGMDYKTTYML